MFEAIKLGLDTDARDVDATLCHDLSAAGFSVYTGDTRTFFASKRFSVYTGDTRTFFASKQQGRVVCLMSGQGSTSYLLVALTCLASSPTSNPPRAPDLERVREGSTHKWDPTSRKAPTKLGFDPREKEHRSGMTTHPGPEEYYLRDLHGIGSSRMLRIANNIRLHAMQVQLDKLFA